MTIPYFPDPPGEMSYPLPRLRLSPRRTTETSAPEILNIKQPIKPRIRSIWVVQDNNLVQQRIKP